LFRADSLVTSQGSFHPGFLEIFDDRRLIISPTTKNVRTVLSGIKDTLGRVGHRFVELRMQTRNQAAADASQLGQ